MKINILLKDGTVSSVPAKWHPATSKTAEPGWQTLGPSSLWTTKSKIIDHLRKINESRKKMNVGLRDLSAEDEVIQGISAAEAPLEIYADTDDGKPWRHNGTLIKEVPYNETYTDLFL